MCGDKGFSCQGGGVINTALSNDFQGLKFLFDKVEIVDVCLKVTCICIWGIFVIWGFIGLCCN